MTTNGRRRDDAMPESIIIIIIICMCVLFFNIYTDSMEKGPGLQVIKVLIYLVKCSIINLA